MSAKTERIKKRLYEIIFEADTPAGRAFDLLLMLFIVGSVIAIVLESVDDIRARYGTMIRVTEWIFTIVFTLEYLARLWVLKNKRAYVFSFYGIVDLLSVLPSYLQFFIGGAHSLLVFRSLRLLRIFRVLKLGRFIGEGQNLLQALRGSRFKIILFLFTVSTSVVIFGTLMYLIEGPEHGFTSIPRSMYWAIVTMTTVGYGDISPKTDLGQTIASLIMILGYAIIAVPTGIVSSEMIKIKQKEHLSTQTCPHCMKQEHDRDAIFCKFCGTKLNEGGNAVKVQ